MHHVRIANESPQRPPGCNGIRKWIRDVELLVQHVCGCNAHDGHPVVLLELHGPVGPARCDGDGVSARSETVCKVFDIALDAADTRLEVGAHEQDAHVRRVRQPRGRGSARIVSTPMKNDPKTTCTPRATRVKPSAVAYSCPSGPKPCFAQSTKIPIKTPAPPTNSAPPARRPCSSRTRGQRRSS